MKRLSWTEHHKHEWFESWPEFVATAAERCDRSVVRHGSVNHPPMQGWDFGVGFKGALRLSAHGWPDGLVKVRELSGACERSVLASVRERRLEYDVAGDWFDVGRVVAGDPECGVNVRRAVGMGPVVRFVVTGGAAAGIDADAIYRRGAAVVAAVDVLESQGVRCEVVLGFCNSCRNSNARNSHGVMLKEAGDAVDMDRLAFALCHPATLRRLSFAVREGLPTEWRRTFKFGVGGSNYGFSETYNVDLAGGGDVVVLPVIRSGDATWRSDEAMLVWLKATVAAWVTFDE